MAKNQNGLRSMDRRTLVAVKTAERLRQIISTNNFEISKKYLNDHTANKIYLSIR